MCLTCFAVPSVTIKLLATAVALIYGQRNLTANSRKWTRRITFTISAIISLALSGVAIFLFVLATNDDLRRRNMVNLCVSQNLKASPLDEHRCSILERGNVAGRVLEFGPGPGTNFKCIQNSTIARSIDVYVAVEPNNYFEDKMKEEKEDRGLEFPLEFVGIKGEDLDISEESSYDAVILTHVLCSVDSPDVVLANAERALKPGGRLIFMEHVGAEKGTFTWYTQQIAAPILAIVGNGCKILNLGDLIENYLGDRFYLELSDFEAPLPALMHFARPHIKGIATKK